MKTPGATTSTDPPKLLNTASVSSHSVVKSSRMNLQPPSPPRTVSKSVRADTLMTSGNAAGTKVPASTAELPEPATMMIPAALAAQTAAWRASVWQVPHARCSPKLMFITSMSFDGSASAFSAIT